jgi:hypothetical protein
MENRRHFVQCISAGVLSGLIVSPKVLAQGRAAPELDVGNGSKVRIGIIGAENSHTISFGRAFNVQRRFPGVEVVAVWGETDEFATNAATKGSIPRIVKEQRELLGAVDAVIIDHRHPKYHAAAAIPFLEAGVPTFIDKPFTYRTQEAQFVLGLAEKHGTPITCLSTAAFGPGIDDVRKQVEEIGEIISAITTGPAQIDSKYGGIFFYGIHLVERLFKIFGDDISAVRATRHGPKTTFQFKFSSGQLATSILMRGWRTICLTPEGLREVNPRFEVEDSLYTYSAIVRMFQTGEEPRSHESILKTVATLEAMERSVYSEGWEFPIL